MILSFYSKIRSRQVTITNVGQADTLLLDPSMCEMALGGAEDGPGDVAHSVGCAGGLAVSHT